MTVDDREAKAQGFMHALAASEADVANIGAEKFTEGIRVTFDLRDKDDAGLVEDVAEEYRFERVEEGTYEYSVSFP